MKKRLIVSLVIFLLALAFFSGAEAIARKYTTNFPLTENPISEGGSWINGKKVGLDWADVSTTSRHAIGNYTSGSPRYNDPTALLTGSWGPNQVVEAKVYSVNPTDGYYQEVEIRLRSSISVRNITGYEILFRVSKTAGAYMQIVRWNGALGDFTYLVRKSGAQYGVAHGDVVRATIIGNVINAYINGILVGTATDSTYKTGNPGMGFNYGCGNTNFNFGFTTFTATDEAIFPPKNQRILH